MFFILLVLYLHFPGYFTMSSALQPGFSGPWRTPQLWALNPEYFWLHLLFHLPWVLWFWVGIFYPQTFFILCSFPTLLPQRALIKVSLAARSYFLESCRASYWFSKHSPSVWFTVIHNLLYVLTLYLCMSILQKFLLVVKTLIRSAATLFSSHENRKQQPN